MPTLQELAVDHPYYCSDSNYYSNEAGVVWDTMTDFLDGMEDADVDMNLVFRWDVRERDPSDEYTEGWGDYYAEVFIMHQRKGKFAPHAIKSITEEEVPRFAAYLNKHWETLSMLWTPLND